MLCMLATVLGFTLLGSYSSFCNAWLLLSSLEPTRIWQISLLSLLVKSGSYITINMEADPQTDVEI